MSVLAITLKLRTIYLIFMFWQKSGFGVILQLEEQRDSLKDVACRLCSRGKDRHVVYTMMLRMNRAVSGTPWYRDVVSRKSVYRWKSSFAAPFDFSAKTTSVRAGPTVVSSSGAQEEAPFIARPSFLSTEGASTQLNSATFMAHEAATSNNTKFDPSKNIEDDGYGLNRSDSKLGWLKRFQQPPDPGTLILVRHGNIFRALLNSTL